MPVLYLDEGQPELAKAIPLTSTDTHQQLKLIFSKFTLRISLTFFFPMIRSDRALPWVRLTLLQRDNVFYLSLSDRDEHLVNLSQTKGSKFLS